MTSANQAYRVVVGLDFSETSPRAFVLEHESEDERQLEPQVWYDARIGDNAEGIHQVAVDVCALSDPHIAGMV